MTIIGISGKKQSGKDCVATAISHQLRPTVRVAFADAVKEEVAKACGVSVQFIEEHKAEFRTILQWWGTDFRRKFKGENYWVDQWAKKVIRLDDDVVVLCPDVRFPNEANFIRDAGGYLFRVERVNGHSTDHHPSEIALDHYENFHSIIENNRELSDLALQVNQMLHTLKLKS